MDRRRAAAVFISAATAVLPVASKAQDRPAGWYIGGEAGWTHLADQPARARIPVFGPRDDNETWHEGFAVGARIGYAWHGWRLEEEFRTQRNTAATFAGAAARGEAVAYATMTNLIYELPVAGSWMAWPGAPWTVHVGAGIGVVTLHEEVKTAGFASGVITGTDTEFGYQAIAGIGYPIAPDLAVELDYRYLAAAEPRLRTSPGFVDGGQPAGNLPAATGYHSHSLVASLIYRLGAP